MPSCSRCSEGIAQTSAAGAAMHGVQDCDGECRDISCMTPPIGKPVTDGQDRAECAVAPTGVSPVSWADLEVLGNKVATKKAWRSNKVARAKVPIPQHSKP